MIQGLFSCHPFRALLLSDNTPVPSHSLLPTLKELFFKMSLKKKPTSIAPTLFVAAVREQNGTFMIH